MKSLLHKMAVTAGLFVCGLTAASAQVLYDANGWEATGTPAWALGNIGGQNGWVTASIDDSLAPQHRVVGTTVIGALTIVPQTGSRMHRSISSNQPTGEARWTWVDLAAAWSGRTSGNNTVLVSMDCFLPSSSSASDHGHGIDAYDPTGNTRLAGWTVQNDVRGVALFSDTDDFGFTSAMARDTWTHFDLVLDTVAGRAQLFIDGVQLAGEDLDGALFESIEMGVAAFGDADLVNFNDETQPVASDFFTDNYRVEAIKTTQFNGQIRLEDASVGDAVASVNVAFLLEDLNGNPVNSVYFKALTADTNDPTLGNYSVRMHDVANGSYKLVIKGFRHLSRVVNVTVAGGTVTVPLVTLKGGDSNQDDSVDVFDLNDIIVAFNTALDTDPDTDGNQPSDNWNPNADFNYDGFVDIFDLNYIIVHFNELGEGA